MYLLNGTHKFPHIAFLIFLPIRVKFDIEALQLTPLNHDEFRGSVCIKGNLKFMVFNTFLPVLSTSTDLGEIGSMRNLHITLFSTGEFRENRKY